MKKNKLKFGVALIMASSMVLSACGSNSNNGGATQSPESSEPAGQTEEQKEVELKIISFRVEDKAYFDELNKAFEDAYPYITVKYDAVPTADYPQLRTARMTTGDVDLIASATEAEIVAEDTRETLADLTGAEFLNNFMPDALKAGQYEGKQYFVPISTVSMVTFYNKQIFADNGLSVPTTWDELIAVSEALAAKGISPIMFGGKDQWPINMIIAQLEQSIIRPAGANSDYYSKMRTEEKKFTDAEWLEVFTKLQTLSKYFQKNYAGLDYGQAPALFAQGKAAMMIDGSWSLAQIEDANPSFETGAFLLPGSNDPVANQVASTKFGFGWMVNKDSKNKDAAIKYLEFMTSKENYQKYNDLVRMLPTIEGVTSSSTIIQEVTPTLTNQMPIWESLQTPGGVYNYAQYATQMILGDITPQDIVEKMQKDYIDSKPEWK
ncbi:ABC transporter substrate-binding protein [Paenibacillus agaridevorans]|uniref:ABC transporter substrate-binding protein n=1 Tax=Paenibacillus agaridevorans TaxID=171404 RepID=UPI001BE4B261|nr:extracellular solute-binding protein [Paenibacillus agaridevorans]